MTKEKQGSDVAGFGVVGDFVAGEERSEVRSERLALGINMAAYSVTSFQNDFYTIMWIKITLAAVRIPDSR